MISRVLSAGLAVAAVLLAIYALRHAYAAALDYQAHRYELLWQRTGAPADLAQWERAVDWSSRALAIDSNNPFMHLRQSRLLQWYGTLSDLEGEQYRAFLDAAEASIAQAVALHPHSADTVSSRAELAARRGRVDEQLNEDIVRSLQMGPWERDVYLRTLNAALFNWPRLDDATRGELRRYFDLAVNEKPGVANETLRIADRYGRLALLCARVSYLRGAGLTEFSSRLCSGG